ncbi:MAG: DUF2281 domain-containing protein [Nitrospira sp.]|nr:DUF2281 domain-containing protein [Nitrospira sp.]
MPAIESAGINMSKASQALKKTIWQKLEKLPARKQAEVLSFVESLGSAQTGPKTSIYDYSASLVKRKRIKKLSLSKIAAIVHEVRHDRNSARSL